MNTQPTPGPWRVESTHVIRGPRNVNIASTIDSRLGYDEKSANAKLIAAAPDLLVALHRALAVIVSARVIACNQPIGDPLVMELQTAGGAVLAAQLAIAKAEGRAA